MNAMQYPESFVWLVAICAVVCGAVFGFMIGVLWKGGDE